MNDFMMEVYAQPPMVEQLHKLLDSEGNKVEIDSVITDDGAEFFISFDQARSLLDIANAISVKHRKEFFDELQTTTGFIETMLNIKKLAAQAAGASGYESNYEQRLYKARGK